LAAVLLDLEATTDQGEVYLTDTFCPARIKPKHLEVADPGEIAGINDRIQLAQVWRRCLQDRLRRQLDGRRRELADPAAAASKRWLVAFGRDVLVEPQDPPCVATCPIEPVPTGARQLLEIRPTRGRR